MKTITLSTAVAGLTLVMATRTLAIEAPEDNSPPPPAGAAAATAPPAADPPNPAPVAASAYLGVVSDAIPEIVSAHLGIKPGEGVVVSAVMPDGPAGKAGIKTHDIITHVGGEPTGSPEELSRQVTSRAPGDTLRIDLIHAGKPANREVVLGTRPADLADHGLRALDQLNLDNVPGDFEQRVRDLIQDKLQGLEMRFGEGGELQALPQMEEMMRGMQERVEKALGEMAAPDAAPDLGPNLQQGATIRIMDNQGSIELKSIHGGKEVSVRDKENNLIWSGPWDTDQDKAAAPDDVRQRVEKLNLDTKFQGNGLRLHNLPGQDGR